MLDVPKFLMRWLYLSNLVRNVAEVQTIPQLHHPPPPTQLRPPPVQLPTMMRFQSSHDDHRHRWTMQQQQQQSPLPTGPPSVDQELQQLQQPEQFGRPRVGDASFLDDHNNNDNSRRDGGHDGDCYEETAWQNECWRRIASCAPGSQRCYALDALRAELVQEFGNCVQDMVVEMTQQRQKKTQWAMQFQRQLREFLPQLVSLALKSPHPLLMVKQHQPQPPQVLLLSQQTAKIGQEDDEEQYGPPLPPRLFSPWLTASSFTGGHGRGYHFDTRHATRAALSSCEPSSSLTIPMITSINPIEKLKEILLEQCVNDPSWGIELCWMLEAEVGRTWKSLFDQHHRSSGTSRLIVVLPRDKATVLAKIGLEKRDTFDFLQEVEQATAYGYNARNHLNQQQGQQEHQHIDGEVGCTSFSSTDVRAGWTHRSDLVVQQLSEVDVNPSLRRCSHFGDTMQFIDRLTQISLDLRMIPQSQRGEVLSERLKEMNRRLRRRMVTRGDISIDVDDGRGPYDWPQARDVSLDMVQYSVHLPLTTQRGSWSTTTTSRKTASTVDNHLIDGSREDDVYDNGDDETKAMTMLPPRMTSGGVVRVLNIVVAESRVLASRERCPYLVHVEVADTGLEGCDARLYSHHRPDPVVVLDESLSALGREGCDTGLQDIMPSESPLEHMEQHRQHEQITDVDSKGSIADLGISRQEHQEAKPTTCLSKSQDNETLQARGGGDSQDLGEGYYQDQETGGYLFSNPYDDILRQHEYERLHNYLHSQQEFLPRREEFDNPVSSRGPDLLTKVYGKSWDDMCYDIRASSPFGSVNGWRLASFIMKAGEDIRRESLVMQVISKLKCWFEREIPFESRPFMRPYTIMCVGGDAGLIECLTDAKSIDEVKKRTDGFSSLREYFERAYGPPRDYDHGTRGSYGAGQLIRQASTSPPLRIGFATAQDNFLRSLVGYSLICYILQIKDRHNANILLDRSGHIMHIDFGFVLGDTPKMGKVPLFSERAPFKLSSEFWEVLGGWNVYHGGLGVRFCKMFELAFECASGHAEEIAAMVEAAFLTISSNPRTAHIVANGVLNRLRMRGPPGSENQQMFIMDLVNAALTSWGTSTYDWLQRNMNGYQ